MAEEKSFDKTQDKKDKKECCDGDRSCGSVISGFKFGFGFFLAFLTVNLIVVLITIAIYYALKAAGISF